MACPTAPKFGRISQSNLWGFSLKAKLQKAVPITLGRGLSFAREDRVLPKVGGQDLAPARHEPRTAGHERWARLAKGLAMVLQAA